MAYPKNFLTVFLAVAAAGLMMYLFVIKKEDISGEKRGEGAAPGQSGKKHMKIPVKVASVLRSDLIITLRSPGEAATDRLIGVKAEVEGVVKSLNIRESQHVEKGDLLVQLEDVRYRLDYENAQAIRLKALSELILDQQFSDATRNDNAAGAKKAEQAERLFNETGRLYRKGLISRAEYERRTKIYERELIASGGRKDAVMAAMKGLTQAEINVKKALLNLEKTKIRAPFSGIVTDINVSPGENITAGRELFTLVDLHRLRVHARVLESEIGKMRVGRGVSLKFSAYPGKVFEGKVKAISPLVDPEDKTCRVIVAVENPGEEIKSGMHAEVDIPAEIHENRLLVPQDAVLTRSGRKLIFVVEDGLAKWRYIEAGLENEDYVEVVEGVAEGEAVVIEGHFTLAHDARVRVENTPEQPR